MTHPSDTVPEFSITNLTSAEQNLLALHPDEEQRSVLYRELLRARGIEPPINLAVAENVLVYPYLWENVYKGLTLPKDDTKYIKYISAYGEDTLRQNMAARLGESLGAHVDKDDVFGVAGVGSALQSIALGLQQPLPQPTQGPVPVPAGSTVLLPAPFWQGFYWSFNQTPKLWCVPVDLIENGPEKFKLSLKDLQRAYKNHPTPKLLALTNPQNPLGVNYDQSLLESIYTWALTETDMHIISDEIYCHSQLNGAKPEFVSAWKLMNDLMKKHPEWEQLNYRERVHVVWGFAKDFGLSGFRAGFVISKSDYVKNAMRGGGEGRATLSWFTPFDSLKHFYIEPIAGNKNTWDGAMKTHREGLTASFNAVAGVLQDYNKKDKRIKFVHEKDTNSALFFWLDLREFLPSTLTPQNELDLRDEIMNKAKVQILPGTTMACKWPGYFRLCFTAYKKDTVKGATENMCKHLTAIRREGC
jgi:aspartate/methionine/tyrosine aminotransferase